MQEALCETPQLSLSFYSYGILLRKATENGAYVEYAVDAVQVAQALAAKLSFDTGILGGDVLWVHKDGMRETVISFRQAQKTGIWIEGSSEPVRVPLPPLVLLRQKGENQASYQLFAVKKRPTSLDVPVFHAPLPNVYASGGICWGNLRLPEPQGMNLQAIWQALLGSAFGTHAVTGKSRQFNHDIRQHLLQLAQAHKRVYPVSDLVPVKKDLRQVVRQEGRDV